MKPVDLLQEIQFVYDEAERLRRLLAVAEEELAAARQEVASLEDEADALRMRNDYLERMLAEEQSKSQALLKAVDGLEKQLDAAEDVIRKNETITRQAIDELSRRPRPRQSPAASR